MDGNTAAPSKIGSAGRAAAVRLGMAGLFASCMLLAMAESLRAQEPSEVDAESPRPDAAEKSVHDYTVSLRGAVWLTWIDGEVKDTSGRAGDFDTIKIDDDLGFDDPTVQILGSANLRLGRHDFWVTGFSYDESEDEGVDFDLDFGDITASRRVITNLEFVDVNFRYGYSPFTFEEHGFRLGPTVAVSYSSLDLELTDSATGEKEDINETFPAPTLGVHGEVPIGDIVLEADVAGVYFDAGSFDGWGLRAAAVAMWRPMDHLGLFAGFNLIYTEISLTKEDIDAALFGPVLGLELRF